MKTTRQSKILELIKRNDIETQEELTEYLTREGFCVTQATVSRDLRELKLTKVSQPGGKQKYVVLGENQEQVNERYDRILREGFVSMDVAQNILVIKTGIGMANAVCTAIDAMNMNEIVGSIAGDDTIICVIRTTEDALGLMKKLKKLIGE